jgi:CheY-like chemotaxis protein
LNSCPVFIEENALNEDSPHSVLLVDDDPFVRTFLSKRLERAGFQTHEAEDGIDGLVKLRNGLPKIIVSDLQMPRMSGMEFVSVVRRRFPFIPVIVLSSQIPNEFPPEGEPDVSLKKGALDIDGLLRTLHDLVRTTPNGVNLPQVVTTPVRTRPGFGGYIILNCPDCLRTFGATCAPEDRTVERIAICTHCEARVPFLVESSEAA